MFILSILIKLLNYLDFIFSKKVVTKDWLIRSLFICYNNIL